MNELKAYRLGQLDERKRCAQVSRDIQTKLGVPGRFLAEEIAQKIEEKPKEFHPRAS